jgi:predicted nuclease of restriction endonuclease-like RecB superfamily
MFSRDLLVTRKRRPFITPVYIDPDDTGLAEKIMRIYAGGKTKGEIDEEVSSLETHATFRVVRGLSELMRRRTHFQEVYSVTPLKIRRYLYEKGYTTGDQERDILLQEASQEFGVPIEDIESSFWADQEEYQIVTTIDDVSASDLIKNYNLSLTQTLLFDALSLEFTTSGNFQEIFRMIKYLGLMYEIQSGKDLLTRVTGPSSLFRKTKKYGTSLAKLIPKIMKASSWKIKAQIETQVAGEPRIYIFELSNIKRELFPEIIDTDQKFDSLVEENFLKRFSSLRKDWTIKREPTILEAGPSVMIPDFSVERRGKKMYIEVVGFWTPEYLEKKTEKIKAIKEEILLLVSKELQCTTKDFRKKNIDIIFYDKGIPMKPVLERIRKMESEQLEEEKKDLSRIDIELTGDIISLEDIAVKYGVGVDAVKEALKKVDSGVVVGDTFVKNIILKDIEDKLENLDNMQLSSVRTILNEYGLTEAVLGKVGFEIEWKTLDVRNATVRKVGQKQ